jgi:DNA-binding MarR family transcriptional regulator
LVARRGPVTPRRAGERVAAILLTHSGLSKLLDRMEAFGLVRRDPDPRDARAAFAAITAERPVPGPYSTPGPPCLHAANLR